MCSDQIEVIFQESLAGNAPLCWRHTCGQSHHSMSAHNPHTGQVTKPWTWHPSSTYILVFSMVHSLWLQASLQDKRTVSSAWYTPAFKPDEREHLRVRPIFYNALSTSTQVKEQPQVLYLNSWNTPRWNEQLLQKEKLEFHLQLKNSIKYYPNDQKWKQTKFHSQST
jgi:hypothetical protein